MTASIRFQKKTHSLQYIDLSSNNITTRCLQLMKVFPNMSAMDVSNTSIGDEMCLSTSRFSFHDSCSCCDPVFCIDTTGWAKQVLNCWKQEYNKCPKPSASLDTPAPVSSTLHPKAFYSRWKPPAKVQNSQNSADCVKKDTLRRLLVTSLFHCSLHKEPALDHRRPLFNENLKNISMSHLESLSPSGRAVLKYSATEKKLKDGELPSLSPRTSKTSNSVVNPIDITKQGMKRKGMNDSSHDKRFCFLNSNVKEKRTLTSLCVTIPSLGNGDRTSSLRPSPNKARNSISLLDLYSGKEMENTGERKLDSGNSNNMSKKSKNKSLLEELDQLF